MQCISARGLALIARYEGFSATPYICPAGYRTIGYGHMLRAGEGMEYLDEDAARELLREDARIAERAVRSLIRVPLSQNQFDALTSFTFNLGGGALQRSTLRRVLNRGEYAQVPHELMRWVRAGGRVLNGLKARRAAEAKLYSSVG